VGVAKEDWGKFDVSVTTSEALTVQCCQVAEILAAEHKRGPTKIPAARKICGRIFFKYAKKERKGAELF
jgi:hypothetical protein